MYIEEINSRYKLRQSKVPVASIFDASIRFCRMKELDNASIESGQRTKHTFKFLTESTTITLEEELLMYNWGDLVADTGGYLGLFLGFSLLTVMKEIVHKIMVKNRKKAKHDRLSKI